jgi:hypothetical protein
LLLQVLRPFMPKRQSVQECPVQMEVAVEAVHGLAEGDIDQRGRIVTFELLIKRIFIQKSILMDGNPNRVDPDKWKPLIMSFQQFYSLGEKVQYSTLAEIPESLYNTPDRERSILNYQRTSFCNA